MNMAIFAHFECITNQGLCAYLFLCAWDFRISMNLFAIFILHHGQKMLIIQLLVHGTLRLF